MLCNVFVADQVRLQVIINNNTLSCGQPIPIPRVYWFIAVILQSLQHKIRLIDVLHRVKSNKKHVHKKEIIHVANNIPIRIAVCKRSKASNVEEVIKQYLTNNIEAY